MPTSPEDRLASRRPPAETHLAFARRALGDLLVELDQRNESRLPAEDKLSAELGLSRQTVRSALQAMQFEGKIVRVHGSGTFLNRHALSIEANLAEDLPFLEVIRQLGRSPSLEVIRMETSELDGRAARRLDVAEDEEAVTIDRLFSADEEPAVLSRDFIPLARLRARTDDWTPEGSTFAFLERWANTSIRYSVATIRAVSPPSTVSSALELPPGAPSLLLDHLHLDDRDQPVAVTHAYVRDDRIPFSVVRTGQGR